jgi:hypothetical protein
MFDNPLIFVIAGVLGIIGMAILLFVGLQMLRDERSKKEAAPAPAEGAPTAEGTAAALTAPEGAPAASEPAAVAAVKAAFAKPVARPKASAHEVMRVLRDNLTGRLVIEIAGRRYASLTELGDAELTDGLLTTLNDLLTFAGGATLPAPTAPMQLPGPASASERAVMPAPASPSTPPTATAKPLPAPSMNPFKQMQVLREMAKNPPAEPKSITEQIDEVLQAKIAGTPLAERRLRMRTGLRGEALFDLDGESYPAVDEVPDMEVREALKGAIAAWEQTR